MVKKRSVEGSIKYEAPVPLQLNRRARIYVDKGSTVAGVARCSAATRSPNALATRLMQNSEGTSCSVNHNKRYGLNHAHLLIMAKTETTVIRVKGTRHYKADAAFNAGRLKYGTPIELRPEPDNRVDPNAVEVLLNYSDKLGHISKDIAPKYQKLCFSGSILSATIESADKTTDYSIRGLDVRVKITYLSSRVDIDHELPASPGVYEISLGLGRAYIGSTGNLKNRVRQHFAQLNDLIHQNKPLQEDFRRTGPEQFTFTVVKHCENSSQALLLEEQEIGGELPQA